VSSESDTLDGVSNADPSIRAADGIRFQSFMNRHMSATWAGGVTTVVTSPQGNNLVAGQAVAFYAHGTTMDDAVAKTVVSLDIHIGNNAKTGGGLGSISGQISQLRDLFIMNSGNHSVGPVADALNKIIPVVAHVQQVDEIASVVRLRNEFGFNLIIMGGAEAHLIAPILAANNVSVILSPARANPSTFETWRAVTNAASILYSASVSVALATDDAAETRNIRWEAGLQVEEGLPYEQGIASITKYPAKLFGLDSMGTGTVQVGYMANFVAYDWDPLYFGSDVKILALGEYVECNPEQF